MDFRQHQEQKGIKNFTAPNPDIKKCMQKSAPLHLFSTCFFFPFSIFHAIASDDRVHEN